MSHPKFSMVLDDARNYLRITKQTFDVISNDLTRVQYKQNASLYTKENFELIKSRLTQQGISCAFVPYHQLSSSDLKILMRTFKSVFPHSSLWLVDHIFPASIMLFIGSNQKIKIDVIKLKSLFSIESIRQDLAMVGIEHPFQLVNYLYLDNAGFKKYMGTGSMHTDNHPILEFTSPKSFFSLESTKGELKQIAKLRPEDYSSILVHITDSERQLVKDFYHFSQLLNPSSRSLYPSFPDESNGTPISIMLKQIAFYREALRIFPDYRWGKALLRRDAKIAKKHLEKQVESLQHSDK